MRAIVYARYSSDLQRDASIADQLRSCRDYAGARGWTIVGELSDAAMSGSTLFRPGVQALLRAVKDGRCDLVLCEGVGRLSRDLADTAALFKQLRYARVALHTILEGVITSMHVGLKDTMNEMYLAELGVRTHRGQKGNVLQGKIAGATATATGRCQVGSANGRSTRCRPTLCDASSPSTLVASHRRSSRAR